jgi:hypothetical protein
VAALAKALPVVSDYIVDPLSHHGVTAQSRCVGVVLNCAADSFDRTAESIERVNAESKHINGMVDRRIEDPVMQSFMAL